MHSVVARSGPEPARSPWVTPAVAAVALSLLLGLQPILTDLYLPALPLLARELAAPMAATQLTMSALILAFGLSQLVWGPLADRYGRRPVLLSSLTLLCLASLGAAAASSVGWLIVWRAAQGATMAAAVVCARAMVRDLYAPQEGARVMALGMSGLGVIAIAAPLAGGALAMGTGWRAPLYTVAAIAGAIGVFVWRWLPETLAQRNVQQLQLHGLVRNAAHIVRHPAFRAWTLLVSCTYGGLFTVLAASSFAYIEVLGLTPQAYGLALGSGSVAYLVGTVVCRRWLQHRSGAEVVQRGAFFTLAGALGMAACAVWPDQAGVAWLLGAQWLYAFGHGFHQPCGQTGVTAPFPQSAGLAAAIAGCALALTAFAIGLWLGQAMDGSLRPMAAGVAVWGGLTSLVAWTLVRRHGAAFAAPGAAEVRA